MSFVELKATKAACEVPTHFPEIKLAFLSTFLIVFKNIMDQTGAKYVPTREWTLTKEGFQQVM